MDAGDCGTFERVARDGGRTPEGVGGRGEDLKGRDWGKDKKIFGLEADLDKEKMESALSFF